MFSWVKWISDFAKRLFHRKTGGVKRQPISVTVAEPPCLERIRAQAMDKSLRIYSRRHPDIRVVAVRSFVDAYRHLLRICDQKQLSHHYGAGHYYHIVTLPGNYGQLVLTDNVGFRRDNVIAVLKINVTDTTLVVKEIRYKLTF